MAVKFLKINLFLAYMMKYLLPLGFGLIFLGMIIVMIAALTAEKGESKFAVGGIIGFIPFGFGNDKGMVWFAMILTAVILFSWIIFYLWR